MLKHTLQICKDAVIPGSYNSLDEQTIGFQGHHVNKKRHNEKNKGDGFQCDSLNTDRGYTYCFISATSHPPPEYIQKNLSPLHSRTMSLLKQLPHKHCSVFMDNLYISAKLLLFCFTLLQQLCHGVCRMGGQGVPSILIQEPKTKMEEAFQNRGNLKMAVLDGVPGMTSILCSSLYNVKPFYMMSTVSSEIKWKKLHMSLFDKYSHKKVQVPFYRLNFADEYNAKMGKVDIGDQLRNYYRFDHWMRKRKWWRSFWMWDFGMLLTNSYILYLTFYSMHGLTANLSHYTFCCEVAKAWINPQKYSWRQRVPSRDKRSSASVSSANSENTPRTRRRIIDPLPQKAPRFTDLSLDPVDGIFKKDSTIILDIGQKQRRQRNRRGVNYMAGHLLEK